MINLFALIKSMGWRYCAYRTWYEFRRKTGLLKLVFPVSRRTVLTVSIHEWRQTSKPFFFADRTQIPPCTLTAQQRNLLQAETQRIIKGAIRFFNGDWITLGTGYDWLTNPVSRFKFDASQHWTEIEDFTSEQGDIKYVWEKSRFCYLYTVMRNDLYNNEDHSSFVFSEILSWIAANPLNCGPHFKCSQEISLRVLNWVFALYFYKNSEALSDSAFNRIVNSIFGQVIHVEKNINFSRFTVRNNHAITEALCLFTAGLLFPWFLGSVRLKNKGRRYLEQEGLYQIGLDGSYIQHSMNYHRVVIQLYTWAVSLARSQGLSFSQALNSRLKMAVKFLFQHQDSSSGWLPNYGPNDGALFFPLNSSHFRDYRPQLQALWQCLSGSALYHEYISEDSIWFNGNRPVTEKNIEAPQLSRKTTLFKPSGYAVLRGEHWFCTIRCAEYNSRPFQADNLHLDIWMNNENIMRDVGTYLYNTASETGLYFSGTAGHNTVMVDGCDQMRKGPRFIWYDWSRAIKITVTEHDEYIEFSGTIRAFLQIGPDIIHHRMVRQYKQVPRWEVTDVLENCSRPLNQIWHPSEYFFARGGKIETMTSGCVPSVKSGWYSITYGVKEPATDMVFNCNAQSITTVISIQS